MKTITKAAFPILIALAVVFSSCKKDSEPEVSIYERLSGIWSTETAGNPTLYIMASEDFSVYFYTYPYPVKPEDEEAGQIEIDRNRITFNDLSDGTVTEYTFVLSDNDRILTLVSADGASLIYTRQDKDDRQS